MVEIHGQVKEYDGRAEIVLEEYRQLGGAMKVIVKEGVGHFEVLQDPKPVVAFILNSQH